MTVAIQLLLELKPILKMGQQKPRGQVTWSGYFSSTIYNLDRTEPGSKLRSMDANTQAFLTLFCCLSELTGQMNRKNICFSKKINANTSY